MTVRSHQPEIERILKAYEEHGRHIKLFRDQLLRTLESSERLSSIVHSFRSRIKDPSHLRDKIERKLEKSQQGGGDFDITSENLLVKITDLVGIRILHLHTHQIREIDAALREIFDEHKYTLIEGPFARTWDDESRAFFRKCGIEAQESPSLYTSVHYVVESFSRTKITAEIQVRTLMEEVWGEVDHKINYPHKTNSLACSEQLKVLARVTASATRLVDAIFTTFDDHNVGGHTDYPPSGRVASADHHGDPSPLVIETKVGAPSDVNSLRNTASAGGGERQAPERGLSGRADPRTRQCTGS